LRHGGAGKEGARFFQRADLARSEGLALKKTRPLFSLQRQRTALLALESIGWRPCHEDAAKQPHDLVRCPSERHVA
jgi:hypothetical protein